MRWNILYKKPIDCNKIVDILLKNRNITSKKSQKEFLYPSLSSLHKTFFKNIEVKKALSRIQKAVEKKEKIIIYSDYDVDGITGTAILWETLYSIGANVLPFVPKRERHGYGLSKKGIADLLRNHNDTKLVITVDNGITQADEVELLKKKGIDVIVTDHHTMPKHPPCCYATIHTTKLSGSGVAYIFSRLIKKKWKVSKKEKDEHLGLAALGTIADLVPLTGANRVIAYFGLQNLKLSQKPGIRALLEISGISDIPLSSYHIGYILAPRMNASGRISHALSALQLLCTKNTKRAKQLAEKLHRLNTHRQRLLEKGTQKAINENIPTKDTRVIIAASKSYHEGVIGLMAGNLVENYYRPAIVIAVKEAVSKASVRSIQGVNIYKLLYKKKELFENFGGHPMAAGFSIKTERITRLTQELSSLFEKEIDASLLTPQIRIDGEISFSCINRTLFKKINRFAPFGVGNPEPVFYTVDVLIKDQKLVGREHKHLKLVLVQNGKKMEAIWFRKDTFIHQKKINVAYTIFENKWNGVSTLQLRIKDIS